MQNYILNSYKFLLTLAALSMLVGCSDVVDSIAVEEEVEEAEEVMFCTMVPDVISVTRSAKTQWSAEVDTYKAVNHDYTFNIEMWKEGEGSATKTSCYKPIYTVENGVIKYHGDGTLQLDESAEPLYWQDNVSKWGFKATTVSSVDVETDQSNEVKWLNQDKLVGYSYLPIWTGSDEDGAETDNVNQINYRTNKQWYADNKKAKDQSGLMPDSNDDYKKIPLYMQHQRAWITIILKSGEGVTREALAYETSESNIKTTIYSYKEDSTTPTLITKAWSRKELINYDDDKNGDAAQGVSTTRYDAIVEPHNFIATRDTQEKDIIARISVSNQNFSFAAANDLNYAKFIAEGSSVDKEAATKAMQAYNLTPGKHLTIIATLSRASRMIMITAWVQDWTETVTQTICDDYGNNGSPILIENRTQLEDFLKDPDKNKAGNVGLVVPNALPLTDGTEWPDTLDLRATLNLAGATLSVNKRLLRTIEGAGSIVNGVIKVSDGFNDDCAVANKNHGTIERIHVTTSEVLQTAQASRAGIVVTNTGTIYQCSSALPVYGTTGAYVGGIVAESIYLAEQQTIPVIESCTVTARVDGSPEVIAGGGIVGQAEGRVSNNTFEYGVTLSQDPKFKNIIGVIGTSGQGLTQHSSNSWPTTTKYEVGSATIVNSMSGVLYNAVIDNQQELKQLLTSEYNNNTSIYRIANSFTLNKDADHDNWIWGNDVLDGKDYFSTDALGTYAHGNVKFKLDGNNKTITLTGTDHATMLFGNILGEVYDLNLILDKPIVAARIMDRTNSSVDTNTDGISAFAYAVTGSGYIHNITLKANDTNTDYIQASIPAGIAVWAKDGGKINNCVSNVHIKMNLVLNTEGSDARRYAGGIVATAEKATITQCKYYGDEPGAVGWVDGNKHCMGSNCRYGGVVGGTSEIANSETHPSLVLTDCSSWWPLPTFSEEVTVRPRMGSLIGSTVYHDPTDASKLFNAMADGNAGNWWTGTVGAGYMMTGKTEEQSIGKRNSVIPTKPKGW